MSSNDQPAPADNAAPEAVRAGAPTAAAEAVRAGAPADTPTPAADTPPEPKPSAPRLPNVRGLDGALVLLLLTLAFFLGSFAVQNSDFFQHLAVGRLVADGEYSFGADPFTHTADRYWINHAWLFDLGLYALYTVVGVKGLVIAKALLVCVVALLLLSIRRPGTTLWLPAVCATLGLLLLSVRAMLQPVVLSMLFLAATFYLLHKGYGEGARFRGGKGVSLLWLLPPLFALWVNVDVWFLLGPITVALYLAGAALEKRLGAAGPVAPGTLAAVLGVGLLACLLNPHLHRAFVLPVELAYVLGGVVPNDTATAMERVVEVIPSAYQNWSPFSEQYRRFMGWHVTGLAYYALIGLGLFGFVAAAAAPTGKGVTLPFRLMALWLFFAVLSGIHARLVGFFAVVAAPVAALLLQDLAARWQRGRGAPDAAWLVGGRVLTGLGLVLLLVFAWPGGLYPGEDDPRRSRRVAWELYDDPSLPRAGARLDELLATGRLTNGYNFSAEAAYALAWHAGPKAKTFLDYRFALFPEAAADFAKVRAALRAEVGEGGRQRPAGAAVSQLGPLQKIFRARKVNYIILTNLHHDGEAERVAQRLLAEPSQFPMLYGDGRSLIFGWRDPQRGGDPFAGLAVDFDREAFGPVPEARRAPAEAPPPPGERGFWIDYLWGKPAVSPAANEAMFHFMHFSVRAQRSAVAHEQALEVTAGLAPAAANGAVPLYLSAPLELHAATHPAVRRLRATLGDRGPPALPLLAVRAGRRAVAEAPDNPKSYSALAAGYTLLGALLEQHWAQVEEDPRYGPPYHGEMLSRKTIRKIQFMTALHQAARLDPEDPHLHDMLAQSFLDPGLEYLDAALEHMTKAAEAARSTPAAWTEQRAEQIKVFEKRQKALGDEVKRRREEYDLATDRERDPLLRFEHALLRPTRRFKADQAVERPRGLALLGLEVLREVKDVTGLKPEQQAALADWQMRLLLMLGRAAEMRELFEPEMRKKLQPLLGNLYDQYEILYCAAVGDYQKADAIFADWEQELKSDVLKAELPRRRQGMLTSVVSMALMPPLLEPGPPARQAGYFILSVRAYRNLNQFVGVLRQHAELRCLRGLLALERGDTAAARRHLRGALELGGEGVGFLSSRIAMRYMAYLDGHP